MKKKILASILIITVCLTFTGCKDKTEEEKKSNETNKISETESAEALDDVKLYSDDTKYVFEYANTKYVFYYKGDTITAYETYVNYESVAKAKEAYNIIKFGNYDDTVDKVYVKGKYIVFEWNKSEYENMSASDLKTAYSYMKEIKKDN